MLVTGTCLAMLCSCTHSFLFDGEGDCSVSYNVHFSYDYNMKYADAFAHEVNTLTLYLIDADGNVVWQKTESGEALASKDYAMNVDALPGEYSIVAWGGTNDNESFTVTGDNTDDMTCSLNRKYDADGAAYTDTEIDRLFYGKMEAHTFSDKAGAYDYDISLVKNTNLIRVVLQHMAGEDIEVGKFEFAITDENGLMDAENNLLPDEEITYYAWHTDEGSADVEVNSRATYSAAIAEITTSRLVVGHNPHLTVVNVETGNPVFSIPLIDYALLVKGFYNSDMDDQEFLDRQDEWDMTFFLDDGERWVNTYICINSWTILLQGVSMK